MQQRIEPTGSDDLQVIEKHLVAGDEVIVQFSERKQYPAELLAKLDKQCQKHGPRLVVRFYRHMDQPFSGRALRQLPSVASLIVDCMDHSQPTDLNDIWSLNELRRLHFGGSCIAEPDFLHGPNLRSLEELGVGPSRKENVNLAPIAGMKNLRSLFISKQSKNIAAIGELGKLESLGLNVKNTVPLDFIPKLTKLRSLKLILGGRDNLDEAAHPGLELLELIRVRGLGRLDPAAFPKLQRLVIDEQAQLKSLEFSAANASLARIKINACKALRTVVGLSKLPKLTELILWNNPALDFEAWLAAGLPKSLVRCDFGIGRPKLDAQYRQRLARLGYAEPEPTSDGS